MSAEETPEFECLATCPNRKGDGLNLFGWHFDPLELTLHLAILVCLGVPAARASVREDFGIDQGLKWLSAIGGASTLIRMSPTDRINAYLKLTGKN
jgi:hypothetical protein